MQAVAGVANEAELFPLIQLEGEGGPVAVDDQPPQPRYLIRFARAVISLLEDRQLAPTGCGIAGFLLCSNMVPATMRDEVRLISIAGLLLVQSKVLLWDVALRGRRSGRATDIAAVVLECQAGGGLPVVKGCAFIIRGFVTRLYPTNFTVALKYSSRVIGSGGRFKMPKYLPVAAR